MANFGIRVAFLIDAASKDEAAQKVAEFLNAASNHSDVQIDAAMIMVDELPSEMGGTGDAPESKPRLTKSEKERRDMIRRSCERRMN